MSLKLLHIIIALCLSFFLPCCLLQRRIFNGSNAKIKQFPYIVNVRGVLFTCGGALISDRFVLTAGHCLMGTSDLDDVVVILGAHNYYNNGETGRLEIHSRKFWVHENFSMPLAENDLAIIELPYSVNFTDQIQPIKIATDENFEEKINNNENETIAVTSGWGYQNIDYEPAEILQTARMKLMPFEECKKFQSHFIEKVTSNHICAIGYDNRPGHATMLCGGDSGSPLTIDGQLIGITSYIKDAENGTALHYNDCKTEIAPAVFIRIPSYLKWISEKTHMEFK
ncbi:hypothetical protein PVAND_011257 [Polypedilum vanderplanki]|uniref:Peptidase S1 domain-containing protein n=1 Tax=Polypedilum vanderplanki TaxID=319348 RepID=A0A9J6CI03_POLVA|nr:hypothetical protein PVAND_011257 [Polypedilum vanderplanki]